MPIPSLSRVLIVVLCANPDHLTSILSWVHLLRWMVSTLQWICYYCSWLEVTWWPWIETHSLVASHLRSRLVAWLWVRMTSASVFHDSKCVRAEFSEALRIRCFRVWWWFQTPLLSWYPFVQHLCAARDLQCGCSRRGESEEKNAELCGSVRFWHRRRRKRYWAVYRRQCKLSLQSHRRFLLNSFLLTTRPPSTKLQRNFNKFLTKNPQDATVLHYFDEKVVINNSRAITVSFRFLNNAILQRNFNSPQGKFDKGSSRCHCSTSLTMRRSLQTFGRLRRLDHLSYLREN